ncbi:MAG TPA: hypothetical protein VME21_04380 [Steroidobacteraceae bacterium]|nr:hypothetical protein [Steroidobacteraceae bacterium]
MFSFFKRRKKVAVGSTPLSDFVRTASSARKKQVYVTALKRASDAQNKVVARRGGRRPPVTA